MAPGWIFQPFRHSLFSCFLYLQGYRNSKSFMKNVSTSVEGKALCDNECQHENCVFRCAAILNQSDCIGNWTHNLVWLNGWFLFY